MEFNNSSKLINFKKLKGQLNYKIWKMRILAILIANNYKETIEDSFLTGPAFLASLNKKAKLIITLLVEDGPLI